MPNSINESLSKPQTLWAGHKTRILRAAVFGLFVVALIWLSYEFWRLIVEPEPIVAYDEGFEMDIPHHERRTIFIVPIKLRDNLNAGEILLTPIIRKGTYKDMPP